MPRTKTQSLGSRTLANLSKRRKAQQKISFKRRKNLWPKTTVRKHDRKKYSLAPGSGLGLKNKRQANKIRNQEVKAQRKVWIRTDSARNRKFAVYSRKK